MESAQCVCGGQQDYHYAGRKHRAHGRLDPCTSKALVPWFQVKLKSAAANRLGRYLGPLLASFFLISGLSYKTTFNKELRISNFPLYSI